MSISYTITERYDIQNTNERTRQILEFVRTQFEHMAKLHNLTSVYIEELTITLDNKVLSMADMKAGREQDLLFITEDGWTFAECDRDLQNQLFSPEAWNSIQSIPMAKSLQLKVTYSYTWTTFVADYLENLKYGLRGISRFLVKEDAEYIQYAGMEVTEGCWVNKLFVCDQKNGKLRFGYLEPTVDIKLAPNLYPWHASFTALQLEVNISPENMDRIERTDSIVKKLDERFGDATPIISDEDYYFALNYVTFNSIDDVNLFVKSVEELYKINNGELHCDVSFFSSAKDTIAAMNVFFDENGELILQVAQV